MTKRRIFMLGFLVFGFLLFFLTRRAIMGSIAVNGEPVTSAEILIAERCSDTLDWSDPSTWCASSNYMGTYLSRRGTFTYWSMGPGDYSLQIFIHPVPTGNCSSTSRDLSVFKSTSSSYAPEVLGVISHVSVQPGLGFPTMIDIELNCE